MQFLADISELFQKSSQKFETSFQKNNIGWPQQPPAEMEQKFKIIFHDSTKKYFFSKHQNKAEFKNPDDSESHPVRIN